MREKSRVDRLGSGTATVGLAFQSPQRTHSQAQGCHETNACHDIPGATCREVTNALEINESVDAFITAGTDLLVIVGGDGTVQGVLCHLFATQPLAQWPCCQSYQVARPI